MGVAGLIDDVACLWTRLAEEMAHGGDGTKHANERAAPCLQIIRSSRWDA